MPIAWLSDILQWDLVHLRLVLHSLAGPVVSILGFQVHADVTLEIGISSNNTQCVSLLVQEKNIEVKNVNLQIAEVYVRPFFLIFWIKWSVCQDILACTTPRDQLSQPSGLNHQ